MPRFEPFAGIRYDLGRVQPIEVTAPPYDVIDPAEREALTARSPHNVVAVDLPAETDGPGRYEAAATTFERWRGDGVLVTDDRPSFTVYRMASVDDLGRPTATVGVIGALHLGQPGDGGILPHEHTTRKAKSDRLELLRATRANLSAVWGLSLRAGLSALLDPTEEPLATWTDDDGVVHTVWQVDDPARIEAISTAVAAAPVVIADGHHRYETSLVYRDERRAADGDSTPAEATLAYVVELVADQLTVRPIHRLLSGLPEGLDPAAVLEQWFEVGDPTVADASVLPRMADGGAIALVGTDGRARLLRPRPRAFDGLADLDSARLAHALPALGDVEVTYQHGVDQVMASVTGGRAQWGVLLRPAGVDQIAANASAGARMPPKTTFFHPKPRTGIVFRDLS